MTRVLVYSDPPWMPTGYGVQTRLLAHGLARHGYDVQVAAKAALAGGSVEWEGITVHPYATPAVDALPRTVRQVQPDLIVTLCDVWPLKPVHWQAMVGTEIPVWSWVPVERAPLLEGVRRWCEADHVEAVVPMSRYGHKLLEPVGDKVTDPVDHAYDPAVFHPGNTYECRNRLGLPLDGPLFGVVAANIGDREMPRKGWPQLLQAWRHRLDGEYRHSTATVGPSGHLLIHSNPYPTEGGVDLYEIARSLRLEDTNSLIFTSRVMSDRQLADLYRALDVLVLPTLGEGYGVPIIEAMACGTPAVTSSWSGCDRLTPDEWQIPADASIPVWSNGAWMRIPHPGQIAAAMSRALTINLDSETIAGMVTHCRHEHVTQQWVTLLKEAGYGR